MWMLYIESGKEYLRFEVKKLMESEERNVWVYETRIKFFEQGRGIFEFKRQELSLSSREEQHLSLWDKN